jgi:hypothetical protein
MEKLRSSDRIRGILASRNQLQKMHIQMNVDLSQIDEEIGISRSIHREQIDNSEDEDGVKFKRKYHKRASFSSSSSKKLKTSMKDAILECVCIFFFFFLVMSYLLMELPSEIFMMEIFFLTDNL